MEKALQKDDGRNKGAGVSECQDLRWWKKPMSTHRDFAALRSLGRPILLVALCGLVLSACAHPVPPMHSDRTIVISGKRTVGSNDRDATRKMLIAAARMTLDHGFRYFEIVGAPNTNSSRGATLSIPAGTDVTIRVYREGEIDLHRSDVRDAAGIAAAGL